MHLPVDTPLQGGKYKIVRFISSGGFGCTYEAEHVMLKKRVAIKEFFVKDFCNREEFTAHVTIGTISKRGLVNKLRNKFVDEARALSSLQHPNIVRVSDVFEENGTAYFVMDFIEGCSLSEILKREGHLSEQRALKYIRQVADALQYVHANNRLHLDVKPSNIIIDKHDKAVLIDFGASKQYDEEDGENTSTLMGKTPGYAPLEQMGNDVVKFTPATDIYALGATLYKLITGATPPSSNLLATGDTLAPLPDTVSPNVATAISVAMRTKRTERPQSIDKFLAIINDIDATTGEEETTIIDSMPKRSHVVSSHKKPKPKKGKPFPIKTVAVVVCLVIAIVGFGVYLNNRDSDNKKAVQTEGTTTKEYNNKQGDMMPDVDRQRMGNFVGDLYKKLKGAGYNIKSLGENEDVFYEKMGDPEYRRKLYDWVGRAGDTEMFGFGTYAEFETMFSVIYARSAEEIKEETRQNMAEKERAQQKQSVRQEFDALYDDLRAEGYTIEEIGPKDKFIEAMSDDNRRKNLYNYVNKKGVVDLGTYTEFESKYGSPFALTADELTAGMHRVQNVGEVQNPSRNVQTATTSGYINGHEYVDLGLSVKWATCNVGASSPSEYGNYYAWGETSTKSKYTEENSKTFGKSMGSIAGNPQYDAACANWGGTWRLPTSEEIKELASKCEQTWTTQGGHKGYKVTGPNGNSIFLPAAGCCYGTSLSHVGEVGFYWFATPYEDDASFAYVLNFANGFFLKLWDGRNGGQSVRPVSD